MTKIMAFEVKNCNIRDTQLSLFQKQHTRKKRGKSPLAICRDGGTKSKR